MFIGEWEATPFWLRWFGKPTFRRPHITAGIGAIIVDWEYAHVPQGEPG